MICLLRVLECWTAGRKLLETRSLRRAVDSMHIGYCRAQTLHNSLHHERRRCIDRCSIIAAMLGRPAGRAYCTLGYKKTTDIGTLSFSQIISFLFPRPFMVARIRISGDQS
jgi:hypothetical protein